MPVFAVNHYDQGFLVFEKAGEKELGFMDTEELLEFFLYNSEVSRSAWYFLKHQQEKYHQEVVYFPGLAGELDGQAVVNSRARATAPIV